MSLLAQIIGYLFNAYYILIIIYVILSWLPDVRSSSVGILIGRLVEPYLSVFRRFIPPIGMIDISPIVALFALGFVEQGVKIVLSWLT